MAKREPAGWLVNDEGQHQWWNGEIWQDLYPPHRDIAAPRGWYMHKHSTWAQWWTGNAWVLAFVAPDGSIDVANSCGQAIVSTIVLGAGNAEATVQLMAVLRASWPPSKIISIAAHSSQVAAGANMVAAIEFSAPDPFPTSE